MDTENNDYNYTVMEEEADYLVVVVEVVEEEEQEDDDYALIRNAIHRLKEQMQK